MQVRPLQQSGFPAPQGPPASLQGTSGVLASGPGGVLPRATTTIERIANKVNFILSATSQVRSKMYHDGRISALREYARHSQAWRCGTERCCDRLGGGLTDLAASLMLICCRCRKAMNWS